MTARRTLTMSGWTASNMWSLASPYGGPSFFGKRRRARYRRVLHDNAEQNAYEEVQESDTEARVMAKAWELRRELMQQCKGSELHQDIAPVRHEAYLQA